MINEGPNISYSSIFDDAPVEVVYIFKEMKRKAVSSRAIVLDIKDPLRIKNNVKEEEENSLDIKWQDDSLKDPLRIKDNVKEEEENSLDIKRQDDILKDPLRIKYDVKEEGENPLDIKWQDDILNDPLRIKEEEENSVSINDAGKNIIEGTIP